MPTNRRLLIALAIGLATGLLCSGYLIRFDRGAGDIGMPLCMGRALLAGADPYLACRGFQSDGVTPNTQNPITTVLIVAPLLPLPQPAAAGVFIGLSSALLSWGLTRSGRAWPLLAFAAFPYWAALQTVQWSPLLLASFFSPALLALTLAKPHIGAPMALSVPWRPWPVAAAVALVALSLAIMPAWPLRMLGGVGAPGDYKIPLLAGPGPLLLLALLRWRDGRARTLLLLSLAPQRMFYDMLLLFALPRSPRAMLALVAASWACYLCWWIWPAIGFTGVVVLLYMPALAIVLWEARSPRTAAEPLAQGAVQ